MQVALLTHQLTPLFHLRSKESHALRGPLQPTLKRQPSLSLMDLTICPASNSERWGQFMCTFLKKALGRPLSSRPCLTRRLRLLVASA